MKAILLTPIILMFMVICLSIAAHGETIDDIAEREEVLLVKQHMLSPDGSLTHPELRNATLRAIDGASPVIEIAGVERLGYIRLPVKQEHYSGR